MLYTFIFLSVVAVVFGDSDTSTLYNAGNKVVVVTGAAQGIGYATAEEFVKENVSHLIILDKNEEKGKLTASELNSKYGDNRTEFIKCDIRTDLKQVSRILFEKYGHIDVIVNNAGILDEYDFRPMLETNVIGTVSWSIEFWEHMRKDKGGRGGTIINIASLASYLDMPFMPVYKASKAAVLGLSRSLGHEYNFDFTGVRVITINPSSTYTAMTKQQMVWDEHVEVFKKFGNVSAWQTPDAVARGILKVYNEAASGTVWSIIGGEVSKSPDSEYLSAEYIRSL